MSKFLGQKLRVVLVAFSALALSLTGLSGTANAQGGAVGLVFISDMTTGGVWVGDISANPQDKELFWQGEGSQIDQVAATNTMVAWSSFYTETPEYQNKVFLAPVGHTAQNVVSVTLPGVVASLVADQAGEKFFITAGDGIYRINSDGTGLVKVVEDEELTDSAWSLTFDPTHHVLYAGFETLAKIKKYQLDNNDLNGSSGEVVTDREETEGVNGIFVDPVTEKIYWTSYISGVHSINADGTNYDFVYAPTEGGAPTGALISNSTSKLFFTVEEKFVEINVNGTNSRTLYTSGFSSAGFEGFAVAFGITLGEEEDPAPVITGLDPNEGPVTGGQTVTISGTGFQNGAIVKIGGVTCEIFSITATEIVCTTGEHAAGAVNVKVTNPDEQEDIETGAYTYVTGDEEKEEEEEEPGSVVKFNKTIYFAGDSATLSAEAKKVLNKIAVRIPNGATDVKIKVYSYVKKATSDVSGSGLAKSRAKAAIKFLKVKLDGVTYKSYPNGRGTSTQNTARKAVIKVTYTTPVG